LPPLPVHGPMAPLPSLAALPPPALLVVAARPQQGQPTGPLGSPIRRGIAVSEHAGGISEVGAVRERIERRGGNSLASLAGWRAACRSWAGCSSWRWSRQRSSRAPTALPSSSRRTPSGSPSSPLPARGAPTSPSTRHRHRRLPPPQRAPADGGSAEEGRGGDGGVRQ
jgi:hypothetical protein